jgi:hypothetical protein
MGQLVCRYTAGQYGPKWAQEKFERWVVGENDDWKKYWWAVQVECS